MAEGVIVSADAVRGYIRALRQERRATQDEVAKAIGMALRTYKEWERGKTKDIKTPHLVRAIQFLKGSFDQIAAFGDDDTAEDGARVARERPAEGFEHLTQEEVDLLRRLNPEQKKLALDLFRQMLRED